MKHLIAIFSTLISLTAGATELHVGVGQQYANPVLAAADAKPGDEIIIHRGTWTGPYYITDLHGTPAAPIRFISESVFDRTVFTGGSEALHFSRVSYIAIMSIDFTGQTGNALNIDDGGSLDSASHHVSVSFCSFSNMGAQGNNDFLKLSGVDSSLVLSCSFRNGAAGGSGIDMVGCHSMQVLRCEFYKMGSNCIQMKGGTQFISIFNNRFEDGGQRTLNLGGSTGLAFFRPQDAKFEAADIKVYANIFVRGLAPIAFVGSERVDVSNNTFYMPEKWVIRILQETVDTNRFVPCRDGIFRNNIVYFSNAVTTHVNVGGNTAPQSFLFTHNLWYNADNPAASTPVLPVTEDSSITGEDPAFIFDSTFSIDSASPAHWSGTPVPGLPWSIAGEPFHNPPSRGAKENLHLSAVLQQKNMGIEVYPNPCSDRFLIEEINDEGVCRVFNSLGDLVLERKLSRGNNSIFIEEIPTGIYTLVVATRSGSKVGKVVKL